MLDKNPPMHRQLKASGRLEKVIEDRADQAESSYLTALDKVTEDSSKPGLTHQEMVTQGYQGRNEAARIALDQATEFETPDEEQTSSLQPEG